MNLIDIHNHCCWGIDDGIINEKDCRVCLKQASEDKIRKIVATPHHIPGIHNKNDIEIMNQRMCEVQEIAKEMNVQLYFGSEVLLNQEYYEMIENHLFHTLADSHYILVEFDVRKEIGNEFEVEDRLYELCLLGYKPIIAHVERYFHEKINIERVKKWIEMGCYIQVNRTSLLNLHGKVNKANAMILLNEGLIHIIASDAHRIEGNRVCRLQDVYDFVKEYSSEENAKILLSVNPERVISNQELICITEKKKRFKGFWRKV